MTYPISSRRMVMMVAWTRVPSVADVFRYPATCCGAGNKTGDQIFARKAHSQRAIKIAKKRTARRNRFMSRLQPRIGSRFSGRGYLACLGWEPGTCQVGRSGQVGFRILFQPAGVGRKTQEPNNQDNRLPEVGSYK